MDEILLMISLCAGMFVMCLLVGYGSILYFPSKLIVSPQSIDEFNQRLPIVIRKIYGFHSSDSITSPRERVSGIFQMFFGGGVSVWIIIRQSVLVFRYEDTLQDLIGAFFILLEILTLAYFLNLGRRLVNIERSKRDAPVE